MSVARKVALVLVLQTLTPALSANPSEPKKDPANADLFDVAMSDGSQVKIRLSSKQIDITSGDRKIKVPLASVLRIDLGLRYPEGTARRVEEAIARLGNSDFKTRTAANQQLLRLEHVAYPALRRAMQANDGEVRRRAAELVRKLEATLAGDRLRLHEHDILYTTSSTITGKIEAPALKAYSPGLGNVQLQLSETRHIISLREGAQEMALLLRVENAVDHAQTLRTQHMGSGAESYEEIPRTGALLVGLEVTTKSDNYVMTFRPIFLTRKGRVMGTTHGAPVKKVIRLEAKPGYAVGAVTVKAGGGVDGISVTFMEITHNGLNPHRAYESEWIGGLGGGEKTKLVGTGAPVVGIFGKNADQPGSTFNGLGLVSAVVR